MTLCVKILSVASTICTAVATVLMIIAIAAPSWRYVYVEKDDKPILDAKQGLWQSCRDGLFKYRGCSHFNPVGIGKIF